MSQEHFWVLFSKRITGEATSTELAELDKLLVSNPEWQYAVQHLGEAWQTKNQTSFSEEEDAYLLHLHRMKEKNIHFVDAPSPISFFRKNNRRNLFFISTLAASVALFLFIYISKKDQQANATGMSVPMNEVSTRLGSKTRVQLPDSSIVWLNAGSKLRYSKDFGKVNREVFLTGEGFFDVKKNSDKPFLIHTSSINIRVLGTVFNVKAYPEDKSAEASLIRGQIEVSIVSRPHDKIILSPNEKLVVENKAVSNPDSQEKGYRQPMVSINKLKLNPVDSTVAETKWIENVLVFNDESFADLALKMERWYGIKVEITDPLLKEKRFTGNFEAENIEQAMEALAITTPFSFERKENKIIIHR